MKALLKKVALILLCLSMPSLLYGADSTTTNKICTYDKIEKNLLVGLNTGNEGLKFSCAYYLGEIKSTKAIIPLMRLFHNGDSDEMKIIAALSLCKIKSERGIFAVQRGITFEDSDRVRRMCEILYNGYLIDEREGEVEVEKIESYMDLAFNGYKLSDFK